MAAVGNSGARVRRKGEIPFIPFFLARLSRSCAMAVDALEYDEVAKPA